MRQGYLVAGVFGRDEDDSVMELRQDDVDGVVQVTLSYLDGRLGFVPLQGFWSEVILDIRCDPPLGSSASVPLH